MKRKLLALLITSLIGVSTFSQTIAVILKKGSVELLYKNVSINSLELYGTEANINKLLFKNNIIKGDFCNDLMNGKTPDQIMEKLIKNSYQNLDNINPQDNTVIIYVNDPPDFINILREEKEKKSKEKINSDDCEVVSKLCIGNKEASFSIGCENGLSLEISSKGIFSLSVERNGKNFGAALNK
jgi:hypothetical protein